MNTDNTALRSRGRNEALSVPHNDNGPVFSEPWQAEAFALAVSLNERGIFTWSEWAQILGDERLDAIEEEVVELGPRLPSNFDSVFETCGCYQRSARAFAFEQRIRANGSAVKKNELCFSTDGSERIDNRP